MKKRLIHGIVMFILIISVTLFTNYFYKRQYIKKVSAQSHYDFTLSATQLDMKLGKIFSVYAVGNDAPKVKWYSSNNNVARINSYGQVIAMSPGQAIITAKYKKQCKDIIVNVNKTAAQDILIYKDSTTIAAVGEALSKVNINQYILTLSKNKYTYTGKAIKPKVSVTSADGNILTLNKDYTIKYQHNKKAGNAQVLVTGIGDYTGSLVGTFKIVKPESESSSFSNNESTTISNTDTNTTNDNSTSTTTLTPTTPENSKISSTRTQSYKNSSIKTSSSTTKKSTSTANSSKTSKSSSTTNKSSSSSKSSSNTKETTKNSFTKSKSSTTNNSFKKSSSSSTNSTTNSDTSSSKNSSSSTNSSSTNDSSSTNSTTDNSSDSSTTTDDSTNSSSSTTETTTE